MNKKYFEEKLSLTPPILKERGKALADNQEVDLVFCDEELDSLEFDVRGNLQPFYNVMINFVQGRREPNEACDCLYFLDHGVCKHLIAAYYTALKMQPIKKRPKNHPYKFKVSKNDIPDPEKLFEDFPPVFRSLDYTMRLLPNELQITFETPWGLYGREHTVKVAWEKEQYVFHYDGRDKQSKKDYFDAAIDVIRTHDQQNLLQVIRLDEQEKLVHDFLKDVNYTLREDENWYDVAEIIYSDDKKKFRAKGSGKLDGLLINMPQLKKVLDERVMSGFDTAEKKQQLFIPQETEEKTRTFLPALAFTFLESQRQTQRVQLLCGVSNKKRDKLSSHIQLLNTPFKEGLVQVDGLPEMFELVPKIRRSLHADTRDKAGLFRLFNELYEHAASIPIYRVKGDVFSLDFEPPKKGELKLVNNLLKGKLEFRLVKEVDTYRLLPLLVLSNGDEIIIDEEKHSFYAVCFVFCRNDLIILENIKDAEMFTHLEIEHPFRCLDHALPAFIEHYVKPLSKEFHIQFDETTSSLLHRNKLKMAEKRLYVSELNNFVILRPAVFYEPDKEVDLLQQSTFIEYSNDGIEVSERDEAAEQQFLEGICKLHPQFKPNTQQSYLYLTIDQFQQNFWFIKAFDTLKKQRVKVFGLNDLKKLKFSAHTPTISLGFSSGQDWFETNIDMVFGDEKITTKQLQKAIKEGAPYVELTDGSLGIIPEEWMKKFSSLFRTAKVEKDSVKVSKTHFNALDELVGEQLSPEVYKEIEEKKRRLANFSGVKDVKPPKVLKATLRDYQKEGLNWLNFLREYSWGGILADDMGLGKTLQALALICLELEAHPKKTNLVIAPTTLLFNWKNEIEKFAPGLDYHIYHGERDKDPKALKKHQLVLTSYGVVVNDVEMLRKIPFNMIVADESQAIKNIHAKRHKALSLLKGNVRISMSGTPIENNIFELYAQMNFANPGFFHGFKHFKDNYATPVERDRNKLVMEELRKKIMPFILRRTKEQVLKELPDKTEEYIYCEMSSGQRKVYDAYRNDYRNYLLEKVEEDGIEKSQMYVLEGLTKLRQICDSPVLLDKDGITTDESAKLDELMRHIKEKTGNHKVLVFSQFVKMLKVIGREFERDGIVYEYLDGSTRPKEREKKVEHFQSDSDCRVFLISIKAGGTGLNLTAADYVYIVDPWWNPAVENQAIDRCYRMGQEKKVFAYRMICKNTVEEKIMDLQQRKKTLSDDIVDSSSSVMKKLTKEDIEELFA